MPTQIEDQLEKSSLRAVQEAALPKSSIMKKVLLVIFIILLLILLAGLAYAGWSYYDLNYRNRSSQKLDSPITEPITKNPASLTIELEQPEDNLLSFQSSIIVSGNTRPNSYIMITSESEDVVIQSKSDGSFSTILNLTEGVNQLKVVVFDETGDQRTSERTIYYSEEKI